MSNDAYGATVILIAVASLVAIGVSRHRVHTDRENGCFKTFEGCAFLGAFPSDQWFELTRTVT
jgi:hypothetical protein